eukprot:TRINITY_DN7190_c0_g1_i1.p1 TRINITY_DN7190_c0_g1~~TRINITY_DN7190_c0_g1_i1.p1  ORF type:complete len:584 (-),score=151.39 TRINITY_DN7190_c0_g1_i1:60-1748(-)
MPQEKDEDGFVAKEFKGSLRKSMTMASEETEQLADLEVDEDEWKKVLKSEGIHDQTAAKHESFVESMTFDLIIGSVIALNALVIGVQLDTKDDVDAIVWVAFESFFAVVWILEMVAKLSVFRHRYFMDPWHLQDFFLVWLAIFDAWILPNLDVKLIDLSFLRLLRLIRLLRLLKLVKVMRMSRNLWLLVQGFAESLSTLNWVFMLAGFVIYAFAVCFRLAVDCEGKLYTEWVECDTFFGTIPKSMYTLFQIITLESWSMEIGRPVIEKQPFLFFMFLLYIFLTTFGLLNIIVGVIVENTLNVANQNLDLQKSREQKRLLRELEILKSLFEAADTDGSGTVDKEEFLEIVAVPDVRGALIRMEVPVEDPETLFDLLDEEQDNNLPFSKFMEGLQKVRGAPTNLDMKTMMVTITDLSRRQRDLLTEHEKTKEMVLGLVSKVKKGKKDLRAAKKSPSASNNDWSRPVTAEEELREKPKSDEPSQKDFVIRRPPLLTGANSSKQGREPQSQPNRHPVPVVGVPVNEPERHPHTVKALRIRSRQVSPSTISESQDYDFVPGSVNGTL